MCSGGASGLPAVEDLPVNETDMRWLELEARFGFCEKEILSILSDFSLTREIDAYKNYAMWQNFNSWMIKFTFKHNMGFDKIIF